MTILYITAKDHHHELQDFPKMKLFYLGPLRSVTIFRVFKTFTSKLGTIYECVFDLDFSCKFSKLQYNSRAFIAGLKRATDEG